MLTILKTIPVVGFFAFICVWIALLVGFIMNIWKTGVGVIALLTTTGVTTDMLIRTGVRAVSLFIPYVNGIAGYF